jgi:hypothetical protein
LRTQVKAAMIFNGHTQDSIAELDETTLNEITVMFADGAIGNYGLLQTLGNLTAGVFNYMLAANSQPYELKSILNSVYGYMYPVAPPNASQALLTFMTQAQGFSMDKFKRK